MPVPHRIAYAPPSNGARPLEPVYSLASNEHIIHSGDGFTILLKTISSNILTTYPTIAKKGSSHMIVLSESGIGAPTPNTPSRVVHSVETLPYYSRDITSLWSPGIKWVPDYRASSEGVSNTENSGRLYLRVATFCEQFNQEVLDEVKVTLSKVSELVGRASPALAPYLMPANIILDSVFSIIDKLASPRLRDLVLRTEELSLWPVKNEQFEAGYAPLRFGSYIFFFDQVYIENLELDSANVVQPTANRVQPYPPYVVIDLVEGLLPLPSQPSEKQLSAAQGLDILEKFDSRFRIPSKENPSDPSKILDGMLSIGESAYNVSLIKRFLYLKSLNSPLPSQQRRLEELKLQLRDLFPGVEWQ
jgi:hypothetical protein